MLNSIIKNIKKDLSIEFRNKSAVNMVLSFAFITTVSVSLTAEGVALPPKVLALLYWTIIYFTAMNSLSHIFTREEDQATKLFLKTASDAGSVYFAKLIFNVLFLLVITLLVSPLYIILNDLVISNIPLFSLTLISGSITMSSATTLLAAIAAAAGGKGALFTIISFPVILPVFMVLAGTTANVLTPASGEQTDCGNILFLLAFSFFIITISQLLFKFLWNNT